MARFVFKECPDCVVGAVQLDVPDAPGKLTIAASGASKADALANAALIAERIASDPVMAALMPPQALPALKVAKGLAAAARRGLPTLSRFMRRLRGPGARRLAATLARDEQKQAEVGAIPFAVLAPLAAKYGPGAARAVRDALKRRQAKKARAKAARATAARRPPPMASRSSRAPMSDEQMPDEQMPDEQMPDEQMGPDHGHMTEGSE